MIRVTQGTYNIGTSSGNSLNYKTGSSLILEGGALNIAGRFTGTGTTQTISFNMSGGTMNVSTVGNSSATLATFNIPAAGSSFTVSGGAIILQRPNGSTTGIDYINTAGTQNITGGTVQFGNASTPIGSTFQIAAGSIFPSLAVNNANSTAAT